MSPIPLYYLSHSAGNTFLTKVFDFLSEFYTKNIKENVFDFLSQMFTPKTQRSKCFTIYETFPNKVFKDERNEDTVKAGPIVFVQTF